MKCGFVSIVGRPNVGKSTLLNSLIGMKLAITSNVSGTTRNIIEGIYNDSDSQIVFVDTPGIHKPVHKLGNIMNKKSYNSVDGINAIMFLIDSTKGFGKGDLFILNRIKDKGVPILLILNKIDLIKDKSVLLQEITKINDIYKFDEVIPISAKRNNLGDLIKTIKKYLIDSDKLYDDEELTNVSTRFIMGEFVREKILELTRDEIPHEVTCLVENYNEKEDIVHIQVLIVVDRENIKKIIIGKNGSMLKEVGSRARYDMEKFLGNKVFLETYVKTMKDWRNQDRLLKELGLDDE
jgi:GTP-binding protein Era